MGVGLGAFLILGTLCVADSAEPSALAPGMDFSSLSSSAQAALATVLSDGFCPCGCPHTVGACLRTHPQCHHAKRMATFAAVMAETGTSGTEIANALSSYYLSFRDPRISLTVDERMCRGSKTAKVTLVEFFDFECPFCGKARPMMEKLVASKPQLRFCAVPFPLPQHPHAIPAGKVALLARDKNKYFAVYDALFENQTHLSVELITSLAVKAGLTAAQVNAALGSDAYQKELEGKRDAAKTAGVNSTPALFFNGHKVELPVTPETLSLMFDDELEWQTHGNAWAPDQAH